MRRRPCTERTRLPQARGREQETKERLALLEEQLSVKETALGLMEEDLEKVKVAAATICRVEILLTEHSCPWELPQQDMFICRQLLCVGGPRSVRRSVGLSVA